eukprot:2010046-Rhodomonas_salina.1
MLVRESVGYTLRSASDDADAAHTISGVASIEAASASGPVTADRYEPITACVPCSFHCTAWPTATVGSAWIQSSHGVRTLSLPGRGACNAGGELAPGSP